MDERELKEIDLLEIYIKNLEDDLANPSVEFLYVAKIEAERIIRKLSAIIVQENANCSKALELLEKVKNLLNKINDNITNKNYQNNYEI